VLPRAVNGNTVQHFGGWQTAPILYCPPPGEGRASGCCLKCALTRKTKDPELPNKDGARIY
jgi:hypothetical protein